MENFAEPARALVAQMTQAAAADPDRAVAFQGAPGANSHIAALEAFPDGLPLPCFDFADAIDAVRDGRADCAIIPIENSLHGRVAEIVGKTEPGAALIVNGQPVPNIAPDGTFRHFTEPLEPGQHTISIIGSNRRGGTAKQEVSIVVPK